MQDDHATLTVRYPHSTPKCSFSERSLKFYSTLLSSPEFTIAYIVIPVRALHGLRPSGGKVVLRVHLRRVDLQAGAVYLSRYPVYEEIVSAKRNI